MTANNTNDGQTPKVPEGGDDYGPGISHKPLDLGTGRPVQVPKLAVGDRQTTASTADLQPPAAGRITAIKTFFTKLQVGAISFLDEQITRWLDENPDVVIKRTNVVTGPVQGKKTEPNIIITVWY
jgi:hypothetical protein